MNEHAKLVVIESPYAAPTEDGVKENVRYARLCLADAFKRGELPFASHLLYTQPWVLDDKKEDERALGIEAGLRWGAGADAVAVYIDRGISAGMRQGIARALEEGRPVLYRALEKEVPEAEVTRLQTRAEFSGAGFTGLTPAGERKLQDGRIADLEKLNRQLWDELCSSGDHIRDLEYAVQAQIDLATDRGNTIADLNQAVADRNEDIASLKGQIADLQGRVIGLRKDAHRYRYHVAVVFKPGSIAALRVSGGQLDKEIDTRMAEEAEVQS